ncbi:OB-fold nucleic acid binding domain-containing protein, partial [Pseudomonas sp. 2995-3]|uniref:OB-fold nucleic acid binding domain-containing protein n=1 Tax=Pseudomonas sp. 2995-3 TaxID=1712680 RepID=UPI00273A6D82
LIGEEVCLQGWVKKRRDLGQVIFVDLRDRTGHVQIVFNGEENPEALSVGEKVRNEYVIEIKGKVIRREESNVNEKIPTGNVEVIVN